MVVVVVITSPVGAVAKYCDECICVCVCLCICVSVCLSARISPEPHVRPLPNFCACFLWPWLGPRPASLQYIMYFQFFFYNGPYSGMNFATKDQFRLN